MKPNNNDEKKKVLKDLINKRALEIVAQRDKDRKKTIADLVDVMETFRKELTAETKLFVRKSEVMGSEESMIMKTEFKSWIPQVALQIVKGITGGFVKLWREGLTVKLDDGERTKPIPVIVVDAVGRPVSLNGNYNGAAAGAAMIPMMLGGRSGAQASPSTIVSGRATIVSAGTRVQIKPTSQACRRVIITAPQTNGGSIYVGDSTVSAVNGSQQGFLLTPTGSAMFDIDNINKIWIDGDVTSDIVTFTYFI